MFSAATRFSLLAGLASMLLLSGCGFIKFPPATAARLKQAAAPIIGEPSFVRVYAGEVNLGQDHPLLPPGEERRVKGLRFIAVGFPIGQAQTLAIDDYELLNDQADPQVPFAIRGDGPGASEYFYSTENFADAVKLTKGAQEVTGLEGQGPDEDALLVSWETPSPAVLMLYEIGENVKTVTLCHGTRTFKLEPDAGLINGKPGTAK
jgi:hypothetical protein